MPSSVPIELYRTIERANASAKAAAAEAGSGAAFGVRRLTASALVEELWSVWGDGRQVVAASQRSLLVSAVLAGQDRFVRSHGSAVLLGSFFARYASKLVGTVGRAELADHENAVLDLAARYRSLLDDAGLVELDEAAFLLADGIRDGALPPCEVTVVDPLDATLGVAGLLGACRAACADGADTGRSTLIGPLPAGVAPAFLVPAGPAAMASLVGEALMRAADDGCSAVLLCGPNAPVLFEALSADLAERGMRSAVRFQLPVRQTDGGRLWRAAEEVLAGTCSVAAACDLAANPLLGLGPRQVQEINGKLRCNRLLGPCDVAALLAGLSPLFARFEAAARDALAGSLAALAVLARELGTASVQAPGYTAVSRRREQAVAAALGKLVDQASRLGVAPDAVVELWMAGSVRVEALSEGAPDAPLIEFATPDRLRSLTAGSYDAVVLSDLSDASFRARAGSSSLDELAEKLGWAQEISAFDEQRRLFAGAQESARRLFACCLPLRTEEGDPSYPAFLFKEYLEALARQGRAEALERGDAELVRAWEDGDGNLFDIPLPLLPSVRTCGEGELVASVGEVFRDPSAIVEFEPVVRGQLGQLHLADYLRHVAEEGRDLLVMSSSSIEAYLGCPYAWFVQKRINPTPLGEQFGPLEKGTFAHAVLAAFYEELAAQGRGRLDAAHGEEDAALLDAIFDDQANRQAALDPACGRLVAITSAERLQLERLRRALKDSLRRQARFAPGFSVSEHEHAINEDDGIDYAGVRLVGRVDRIDVNADAGQFCVIDYKGNLGSGYSILQGRKKTDEPGLPDHSQAYMYAQALRSQLEGLHCVGALYLSYKAKTDKEMLAGAVQDSALGDPSFIKGTSVSPLAFDALLDRIETQVAAGLAGIYAGDISENPRYKDVCAYCPVPDCARRQK